MNNNFVTQTVQKHFPNLLRAYDPRNSNIEAQFGWGCRVCKAGLSANYSAEDLHKFGIAHLHETDEEDDRYLELAAR